MTEDKRPVGRPSEYDPAYCEKAVEFLAEGFSVAALAGEIGVQKQTVYNWMDENPEFLDAVKAGQAKATLWWEKANKSNAVTGEGNATSCIFGLKNRAPDEWRDKTEQTQTHEVGDSLADLMKEIDGQSRGLPNSQGKTVEPKLAAE